ncbi:PREDICTED: protein LTV1 homolog [Tarenaya hassleriana]|uniref:protein LTV1 homolog n=1 Tax=Tarenaya hassleriana TaxID=28532 RepID=UPI00053C4F24|nr:PREDICTED: protein LTV1 homolog [Tarenaya hassleriana]XP_010539040.1 PREDICTED: protein LTV1 homolog [Tarenaya hassleriana]
MGKTKKFIDKKKAATFELCPRDSSDPRFSDSPGGDKVFVRVDRNPVNVGRFSDEHGDSSSLFADAPEDYNDGYFDNSGDGNLLPDDLRKEILELGFPDDGYNYLAHLREIKNTGAGSAFYLNPKAKFDELPRDVKAYDASRVKVPASEKDANEKSIYSVASSTFNVGVQRVMDPEVAALLENSDLSEVGSDVEDLEEDFVIRANLPQQGEGSGMNNMFPERPEASNRGSDELRDQSDGEEDLHYSAKPWIRRDLDEQFDLLELNEYGSYIDDDDYNGYLAEDGGVEEGEEEEGSVALRLQSIVNENPDDFELGEKYLNPADLLKNSEVVKDKELLDSAAVIIRRCAEYAEKYENGNEDDLEEMVVVQESSDESEKWDCETIITTYSNLDNHPGKIQAPGTARKHKLSETVAKALSSSGKMISLQGKEKLPVDFLPQRKSEQISAKAKDVVIPKNEPLKRKPHGQESKEEKKERKAAVKNERREARRAKKEMKGLYRFEAQLAQRAVAVSLPSSIHL